MQYRFFMYHFGPVYVKCKKISRNGKIYFRDEMGNEMPASKTAKSLSGASKDQFCAAYNQEAAERRKLQKMIHPEDGEYPNIVMTYEEIIAEIKNENKRG